MINKGDRVIILKSASYWPSWNRHMEKYVGTYAKAVSVFSSTMDMRVQLEHPNGECWWWPASVLDTEPEGGI